jgi:signal transduction histidine kinase
LYKVLNPVAEALTGWKQEDALNRNLQEVFNIINTQTRLPVVSSATEVLNKGISVCLSERINLVSKNGIELPITDSAAPLKNRDGEITGAVIVFRSSDRTDIKSSQQIDYNFILLQAQQLEIQKAELQRQNQLKDDFVSTVTHELRSPISNIKMAIKMLQLVLDRHGVFSSESNSESIKTTRYFQILHEQCEQEVNLINDLLDLQRLDADVQS